MPHDCLFTCLPNEPFHKAIACNDVNEAYALFLKEYNSVLRKIAVQQGPQGSGKDAQGRVRFHDPRRHPRAIQVRASSMQSRKMFNQASEVAKAQPGHRRDKTWRLETEALPDVYKDELVPM